MSFPTRQLDYRCKLWELMVTYAKGTVFQCGLIKYGESSLSKKKKKVEKVRVPCTDDRLPAAQIDIIKQMHDHHTLCMPCETHST